MGMRLAAPIKAPKVLLKDIAGNTIDVAEGQRTYLAFFRDASCPFCNVHIYKLTQNYDHWAAMGLNMVAVFASTPEEVKRFILARPRPFPVAAEPTREAYDIYGLKSSFWGKLKAILMRTGTLLLGLRYVGLHGFTANNMMPADFLIDESGHIVEAYYGKDAGDHLPFERIELFLARGMAAQKKKAANQPVVNKPAVISPRKEMVTPNVTATTDAARADEVQHMAAVNSTTLPFPLTEKVPVSYLCNAYSGGKSVRMERVTYPIWKSVMEGLLPHLAAGATVTDVKKALEGTIEPAVLAEIKRKYPQVHAVDKIEVNQDAVEYVLQRLSSGNVVVKKQLGINDERWQLVEQNA